MAGATGQAGEQGWSSRTAFLLAAIGAAVGLGNIWRFPTLAGENGGGAFVLVYIGCVFLIGLPLVLSEVMIGRTGREDAAGSIARVAEKSGVSTKWRVFGGIEIIAAFLILSFYSVVAGWALYYVFVMIGDVASSIGAGAPFGTAFAGETQEIITGRMGSLFGNLGMMIGMHTAFMAVTVLIVAKGVHDGIEKAASTLMPAFFVLLVAITIYGAFTGEFAQALAFLFTPDFSELTPTAVNEALGQALFSLSLGSAALITYGAYVGDDVKLAPTAGMIAAADTGVALLSGLMIFPIVFAVGLDPAAGPVLVFQSLPVAFSQMPAGSLIGLAFFVLIFFAALTSSISLLEGPVAWVIDRFRQKRLVAALLVGGGAYVIGLFCAMGYNVLSDVRPLWFWDIFANNDILDSIDGLTGKVMLPLAALGVSLFIGWKADRRLVEAETGLSAGMLTLYRLVMAWLAPVAVFLILLFGLFPGLLGSA
ncbi:MAG: sodium-dependent transporter [Croceicoccus sp.]|nr:sodium-dependent transporter [Croceicoccus sp.]|tara:strand:+ start:8687 stop:10123 length:1437 start_codon:yes stop_codon:yes gene_type:complete